MGFLPTTTFSYRISGKESGGWKIHHSKALVTQPQGGEGTGHSCAWCLRCLNPCGPEAFHGSTLPKTCQVEGHPDSPVLGTTLAPMPAVILTGLPALG